MPAWVVHPILIAIERREWIAVRLAAVVALLGTIALGHVGWKVIPPYAAHYRLQDQATVIGRAHAARSEVPGDTPELRSALMHAVRAQGLEAHIGEGDFKIESTLSRLRISCRYLVIIEILPGVRHTLRFRLHVEEPVLPKPGTIFL
jgi:hypothetical protein